MRLFTVEEANELLPAIVPRLEKIRKLYESLSALRGSAELAASASERGGGMAGGSGYVKTLYEIGKLTTDLSETGVELKDHDRGLIDFPSLREGRIVYLCWQLGEKEEIRYWHELEAGFMGRQLL